MTNYPRHKIVTPLSLGLVIALLLSSVLFVNAGEYWHTSHGPEGGIIQALAVDSGGNLYAGTYRGWVFRGTFSGSNLLWTLKKGAIPVDGRDISASPWTKTTTSTPARTVAGCIRARTTGIPGRP